MTNKPHVTNNHMGSGIVKFQTNTQLHNTFTSETSAISGIQKPGLGNSFTNGEAATLYSQAATFKDIGSSPDNRTIPLRDSANMTSGTEVLRVCDLITNGSQDNRVPDAALQQALDKGATDVTTSDIR